MSFTNDLNRAAKILITRGVILHLLAVEMLGWSAITLFFMSYDALLCEGLEISML